MAPRIERSEKELSQDINAAIAGTEDEIFTDAMGDDELDNDGDTSLEEMGEGLEGDHLEDEESDDEDEAGDGKRGEKDEDAEEDEEDSEDEEEEEVQAREEQPTRDERGRFERQPRIPPERLRHEAEQRRQAEQRAAEADQRYQILEARFNDMQARINAPPQRREETAAPPPKPDMFVEPEKYEQWVLERAAETAMQNVQRVLSERDEQQRTMFNQNVDRSLQAAKTSERGFEFDVAYSSLLKLNPQNPQDRATVQRIVYSQDPGAALFDWWDKNGGDEYRENLIARLTGQDPPRRDRGREDRGRDERRPSRRERDDRYDDQSPRHEFRPARPLRSLNAASGGSSHRIANPEMLDGSESSVFDFATRK